MGHRTHAVERIGAIDIGHHKEPFLGHDAHAGNAGFILNAVAQTVAVAIHEDSAQHGALARKDTARIVEPDHGACGLRLLQRPGARLAARQDRAVLVAAFAGGGRELHHIGQLMARQRFKHAHVKAQIAIADLLRVVQRLSVEGDRAGHEVHTIGGPVEDFAADQRLMHVVGEAQRVGDEFTVTHAVEVGGFVQRQRRAIIRINRDVGDEQCAACVFECAAPTGIHHIAAHTGIVQTRGREDPCGRVHHGIAVVAFGHFGEGEKAALVGLGAGHFVARTGIDKRHGHAVNRGVGDGVEQKVAGVDHQIVLKHRAVARGCRAEAIAKVGGHDLIPGNGGRHLRHRQGGGEEDTGVGPGLGRDDGFHIAGQHAADRHRRAVDFGADVAGARGEAQAGVAARRAIGLVRAGLGVFKDQGADRLCIAVIDHGVGGQQQGAFLVVVKGRGGVLHLHLAQVGRHAHREAGIGRMADGVVALMKEGHRIHVVGKPGGGDADVVVVRRAAHMNQRGHGARILHRVEHGVQRDRIAQQDTGPGRAVDHDWLAFDLGVAKGVPLGIVAQPQGVGDERARVTLGDDLLFRDFEPAFLNPRDAHGVVGQALAILGHGRCGQHAGELGAYGGLGGDAELIDQLQPLAHGEHEGRGHIEGAVFGVDQAVAVQVREERLARHHSGAALLADADRCGKRHVAAVDDVEMVAAKGTAGQQKVGVAGHFEPGNRGDFGPYRVREDAFHDAKGGVEIADFCHVADERPTGGRGGGGGLGQKAQAQCGGADQGQSRAGFRHKETAHQLAPVAIPGKGVKNGGDGNGGGGGAPGRASLSPGAPERSLSRRPAR